MGNFFGREGGGGGAGARRFETETDRINALRVTIDASVNIL